VTEVGNLAGRACLADGVFAEKLLPTGVPEKYSPSAENFLFGSAGLSFADLNNRGIVAFTVKWPKLS